MLNGHLRALACVIALSFAIVLPRSAAAIDVVDLESSFRMTLAPPGAQACVVFPDAQRDPANCPDLTPPIPPGGEGARHLLVVEFRYPDWQAFVQVNAMHEEHLREHSEATATQFVAGVRSGLTESGARLVPVSPEGRHDVLRINGLQVIHHVAAIAPMDGQPSSPSTALVAYHVVGENAIVSVMATARGADDARLTPMMAAMIRTIRMNPAPRAETDAYRVGYLVGRAVPLVFVPIAFVVWLVTRKKRAAAPPPPRAW